MKILIQFSVVVCTGIVLGCSTGGGGLGVGSFYPTDYSTRPVNYAYFDKMPTEGWATDPHYSYAMYSYWPFNTRYGGFGPHGPESIKRIGI